MTFSCVSRRSLLTLKVTFWSHVSPEAGVTSAAGTA